MSRRAGGRLATGLACLALAAGLTGCAPAKVAPRTSAASPCGFAPTGSASYREVVWIWFENHSYDQIVASPRLPYLNSLIAECGLETDYHAITHPSTANYVAATSGVDLGPISHCTPAKCPEAAPSLFGQLQAAGLRWGVYEQRMPRPCDGVASAGYTPIHNPPVFFPALAATCPRYDLRLRAFHPAAGTLPSFSLIVPDTCNDMHSCPATAGDRWLAGFLPPLLASPGYRAGHLVIFITWDEGSPDRSADCLTARAGQGCHVPLLVIAPTVPEGRRVARFASHYALLRTTEALLGLGYLAAASHAADLRAAFGL